MICLWTSEVYTVVELGCWTCCVAQFDYFALSCVDGWNDSCGTLVEIPLVVLLLRLCIPTVETNKEAVLQNVLLLFLDLYAAP